MRNKFEKKVIITQVKKMALLLEKKRLKRATTDELKELEEVLFDLDRLGAGRALELIVSIKHEGMDALRVPRVV